jgi:hypothetical protein
VILRVLLEQSLRLQRVGNLGDQLPAHPADVGERGQYPDRRGAKRDHAERFDDVAGCAPREEVGGERLLGRIRTFHAPHLLDQEPQRRVHEILIEPRASHRVGERDLAHLACDTGAQPQPGSQQPFRQRQQVALDRHPLLDCRQLEAGLRHDVIARLVRQPLDARQIDVEQLTRRFRALPAMNTESTFDESIPRTTTPIGSLIGSTLMRSVRSMMMSASLPASACRPCARGRSHGRLRSSQTPSRRGW